MTRLGVRVDDVGEVLPWPDLRDFIRHLPPDGSSALFRVLHPKSWWWTPDHDFFAALLTSLQLANWQRAGGKGDRPKPVKRPKEDPRRGPKSAKDLAERKQRLRKAATDGG